MNPIGVAPPSTPAAPPAGGEASAADGAAGLFAQLLAASAPGVDPRALPPATPPRPTPEALSPDPAALAAALAMSADEPAPDADAAPTADERGDAAPGDPARGDAAPTLLPALLMLFGPLTAPPPRGDAATGANAPTAVEARPAPHRGGPPPAPAAIPAPAATADATPSAGAAETAPLPADMLPPADGAAPVRTAPAPAASANGNANPNAIAPAAAPSTHEAVGGAHEVAPAVPAEPAPSLEGDELADALAARLTWQAHQQVSRAEIRVSPPELGAIEIDIQLDGRELRAEFSSANAEVRQALEAGLPRLRELLDGQGLQLVHAEVGGHGRSAPHAAPAPRALSAFGAEGAEPDRPAPAALARRIGLLDEYA